MVTISWFGHCCFEVKGENYTVLTDPHDGVSLGLPVPDSNPDVVLISHPHDDHSNGRKFYDYILDFPSSTVMNGSEIRGVKAFHDDAGGERLGVNIFFRFEVDEIRFGHSGDLGHILNSNQLDEIGEVDVLFSGIGEKAQANIDLLKPWVVIPMH